MPALVAEKLCSRLRRGRSSRVVVSRMWDRDISDIDVDRARQAVGGRTTLHWVTRRHIKNWYLQRAVLAGYDRVQSAARVVVNVVVGGGGEGGGVHGLPWSAGSCW